MTPIETGDPAVDKEHESQKLAEERLEEIQTELLEAIADIEELAKQILSHRITLIEDKILARSKQRELSQKSGTGIKDLGRQIWEYRLKLSRAEVAVSFKEAQIDRTVAVIQSLQIKSKYLTKIVKE